MFHDLIFIYLSGEIRGPEKDESLLHHFHSVIMNRLSVVYVL